MRKLIFDPCRPAGRLFYCLISVMLAVGISRGAPPPTPPATTTISDVIYRADGSPAAGTLLITWPAFTTADNRAVPAGSMSLAIGPFGAINLALAPNQGATPTGSYYKVVYKLNDGTTSEEFWVVPTLSPTTISAIRSQVVPAGVALQVVSRQYVDGAIASATASLNNLYVLKSGDTMTGFLTLSGNPTQTLHASTKSYVDTQVGTRALDSAVVHLVGSETITGVKAFSASPTVPTPTAGTAAANKSYVDSVAGGSGSFVLKSGDTMTGLLTLSGGPTQTLHASTKGYVDTQVATRALDSAVVHLTGNETVAGIKQFSSSPTVPTPAGATDAPNKSYVDTQVATRALDSAVVHLAGAETITGVKTFSASPTVPTPAGATDAPNKSYVDTQVATRALDSAVVHLAGTETVTGAKAFSVSPTVPTPTTGTAAANKSYVDGVAGGSGTFVLKSGDTMTGALTLSGDPMLAGHASNKNYVDAQVATRALDSVVVHLTGNETVAGIKQFSSSPTVPTPAGATDAANKAYVDGVGGGAGGGVGGAFVNAITDCGAVGDGVTDDYAAIQNCINNNPSKTILVPKRRPGLNGDGYATQTSASVDYRSSQRITLRGTSEKLLCTNGGEIFNQGAGCIIAFDSTATGGLFIGGECNGCAVVGIGIYGRWPDNNTSSARFPGRTDDGILITGSHVLLDRTASNHWGRHGINIDGTHNIDSGTPDLWDFRKVTVVDNQQDGIFVHGSDSNQGACWLCNAFGNDHVGIRDNSELGNVWIAPHTNSNGEETTIPAAQNISTIARASNVVTVTLTSPTAPTPVAGNAFTVAGVTDSSFNGTFLLCGPPTAGCATPTASSFTYQQTAAGASSSGGTAGYATLQAISTTFWDGFIGAYASTGGGADTWLQPYAEGNQGNGTTCVNWQLGTMVLQPNLACGVVNDAGSSPLWTASAKGVTLRNLNVFSLLNAFDATMHLILQAGKTVDQTESIDFADRNATVKASVYWNPATGIYINGPAIDGAFGVNLSGASFLRSSAGQTSLIAGEPIDFTDNPNANHLRARMYTNLSGGGPLAMFNTTAPHFAGATSNNYMAWYTPAADCWAVGNTSNPINNPSAYIAKFCNGSLVSTFAGQMVSEVATGTAPLSVASITPVTNLTLSADTQLPIISTAGKVADSALSSNIPRLNQANSFGAGQKETFQNSASTAGLNLASSADPSSPAQGDVWINSSDLKFRGASATQSAERQANKGAASGYASLDAGALVPSAQLPNPAASAKGGVQSKDCSASGMIQKINTDSTVSCSTTLTSTSVVTVSANTTADQNLMSLSLPAGALNTAGRFTSIAGAGVYSTASGQTPTLTFKVKLCTVSGCGSGTVLILASWTTASTTASAVNMPWKVSMALGTISTGATGTVEGHGNSTVTLGTTAGAAAEVRSDTVTAASSAIDLTAALFLQFTVATSTSSASNSISQRQGLASAVN